MLSALKSEHADIPQPKSTNAHTNLRLCNAVLKSIIIPRVTIVRKRGDTDTQSHTSHTPTHSLLCPCPIVNTLL